MLRTLLTICFLVVFPLGDRASPAAADYQPKPLPAGSDRCGAAWKKGLAEYHQATVSDTYLRIGHHDPRWDKAALAYLGTWQRLFASGDAIRPMKEIQAEARQLLAEADAIIAQGCTDPMIHYLSGRSLTFLQRPKDALVHYRLAWKGFLAADYTALQRAYAGWRLCQTIMQLNNRVTEGMAPEMRAELNEVFTASQRHGQEMLTSAEFVGRPDHCLYQAVDLFSDQKPAHEAFREALIPAAKNPKVDPWLSLMLQGNWEVTLAWRARGDGFADTVTKEGAAGFREHLALARKHLENAHHLRPDLPQAATRLITVSMADNQDDPRRWFDAAVAAQFDYVLAHDALEYALMPRWGGSHEEMVAFARECLATKRFDTDVPMRYLAVWQSIIGEDGEKDTALWKRDESIAEDLDRLFIGMAEARQTDAQWYQSLRVAAAVACGRKAIAVKVVRTLKEPIEARAWKKFFLEPAASQALLKRWSDEAVEPP